MILDKHSSLLQTFQMIFFFTFYQKIAYIYNLLLWLHLHHFVDINSLLQVTGYHHDEFFNNFT